MKDGHSDILEHFSMTFHDLKRVCKPHLSYQKLEAIHVQLLKCLEIVIWKEEIQIEI